MDKCYRYILVPLDGSELAELALTDAFALAKHCQAEVTLLQAITPAENIVGGSVGYPVFVDEQWSGQEEVALHYLNSVCKRMVGHSITVHTAVEVGTAAETIIDYAHQHSIDLIVMATHGRSGLQRWVYGSVADKVLRGADVPILLVRAHPKKAHI